MNDLPYGIRFYEALQIVFVAYAMWADYTGQIDAILVAVLAILLAEMRMLRNDINE